MAFLKNTKLALIEKIYVTVRFWTMLLWRTHIFSLMKAALPKCRSFICNYQRITYHLPTSKKCLPIAQYLCSAMLDEGVGLCSQLNLYHTDHMQIYKQPMADLQYYNFFGLKITQLPTDYVSGYLIFEGKTIMIVLPSSVFFGKSLVSKIWIVVNGQNCCHGQIWVHPSS